MRHEQATGLRPLLDYLASLRQAGPEVWHGWNISRVAGGANNLLFRATGNGEDFAVKFTIRDDRNRADREFHALRALAETGLAVAPEPVLLDRDSYPQPVVVQRWLAGEPLAAPPSTENDWNALLRHFATIHSVTPTTTTVRLPAAVLNAHSVATCRAIVLQQWALLPPEAQPARLQALLNRLETSLGGCWPTPPTTLCRVDPNVSNFVRRPGPWASVDWENSGWGDPAFEIADLMSHPAYTNVPMARWEWVIDRYCRLAQDRGTPERIQVYRKTMLVWWVARFARVLYEVPRGADRRLVERPPGWEAEIWSKYHRYLALADHIL